MEKIDLNRAHLAGLMPTDFAGMMQDTSGNPCVWHNDYLCTCGEGWEDWWSCGCDDDCPACGLSISPSMTRWHGPANPFAIALWELLPEAGAAPAQPGLNLQADPAPKTACEVADNALKPPFWPNSTIVIRADCQRSKGHAYAGVAHGLSGEVMLTVGEHDPDADEEVVADAVFLAPGDAIVLGYALIGFARKIGDPV